MSLDGKMKPRRFASAVISSIDTRGLSSSTVLTSRDVSARGVPCPSSDRAPRLWAARDETAVDLAQLAPVRGALQQRGGLRERHPAVLVVHVRFQRNAARIDVRDEERHVDDAVTHRIVERVELARGEQRCRRKPRLFDQLAPRGIRRALAVLDAAHHERPRAGERTASAPQQQHLRVTLSLSRGAQHDDGDGVGLAVGFQLALARGCVSAPKWPHAAAMSGPIGVRTVTATPRASRIFANSQMRLSSVPRTAASGVLLYGITLTW